MPMQRKLYPADWETIAYGIKEEANWQCEECGRPCRRPDETLTDFVVRLSTSPWLKDLYDCDKMKPTRFILTVAHIDHRPENCDRSNLRALCSVCHLRYDSSQMSLKRNLQRERKGQIVIAYPQSSP